MPDRESINCRVVTPTGTAFEKKNVTFIKCHGPKGEIGVLPNHSSTISKLSMGDVVIRDADGDSLYYLSEGVLHIRPEEVVILTPSIEPSSSIDKKRAVLSKERALKRLAERGNDVDKSRARLSLLRSEARLTVVKGLN